MNEMDELRAFFTYAISILEQLDIPYMVVGGYAATVYGEPRMTVDVDIVVDMRQEHVRPFVAAFPDSAYYVSEESVRDSLARRYPFNVIESATAAKVDLVPLPHDVFSRMAFGRRQRIEYIKGHTAEFITPEDVVVAKLLAHKATESEKHLRDALGVLVMQWGELNLDLMQRACRASNVLDTFEEIMKTARHQTKGESGSAQR